MSVGKKIKMMRELRNYTQKHMSSLLEMSPSGYSKIERDETDISLKRLQQIAEILGTDTSSILSFDEKQVFNICHNMNGNGVVQNQHLDFSKNMETLIDQLREENAYLRKLLEKWHEKEK